MEFTIKKNPDLDVDSFQSSQIMEIPQLSNNGYQIIFRGVIFDYQASLGKINEIEKNPFTIEIPEGDKVLLLEKNDIAKEYLVYALTKNLPQFRREWNFGEGCIEIGNRKIN